MNKTKRFNKELYDKYDALGKAKAIEVWKNFYQMEARENPDKYGTDLFIFDGGKHWAWCEVTIRINPISRECMVLNSRRSKQLHEELPLFFFSFNHDLTELDMTTARNVKEFGESKFYRNGNYYFTLSKEYFRRFRCDGDLGTINYPLFFAQLETSSQPCSALSGSPTL